MCTCWGSRHAEALQKHRKGARASIPLVLFLVDIFELWQAPCQEPSSESSETSHLLDELDHLALLDGARAILIELTEALVEVFVIEASAVGHVGESVANELLCLFLVQVAIAICVILSPDFVNALCDNHVNFGVCVACHIFSFF